jgi:hypothetical protein
MYDSTAVKCIVAVFVLVLTFDIHPVHAEAYSTACRTLNGSSLNLNGDGEQVIEGAFARQEIIYANFVWLPSCSDHDAPCKATFSITSAFHGNEFEKTIRRATASNPLRYSEKYTIRLKNLDPNRKMSGNWSCTIDATPQKYRPGGLLLPNDAAGAANQGAGVSLSSDGNTAIVGGWADNSSTGAAWVFTRGGGTWSQQGSKLVGNDAVGAARQGRVVAISADGNTAIFGGTGDNSFTGAAWVFTRSGGVWSQQGPKLVGTPMTASSQGFSVALSGDGNTAIVGGPADNSGTGAAWVYTRNGGVWSQQGAKLLGSDAAGTPQQGYSVALSADGNTAIVGGASDNSIAGAAWVYTRSGGVWTQQGPKLVGNDALGTARQGFAVALSADGNTALVGGFLDDNEAGAAWVFTRSGGVWTQQGSKLVGGGAVGGSQQGFSVALSANGNIAMLGGPLDNAGAGAAWVFKRSNGVWAQQGSKLILPGATNVQQGYAVALSGDGATSLVGRNQSSPGGAQVFFQQNVNATHDFNADDTSDVLWRDSAGNTAIWLLNGPQTVSSGLVGNVSLDWSTIGQRSFDFSGGADLLWRHNSGTLAMWFMNGFQVSSAAALGNVGSNWTVVGTGDLNADGIGDILWRDSNTGTVAIWFMNGAQIASTLNLGTVPPQWSIIGSDNNGNVFWRDASGNIAIWEINGSQGVGANVLGNVSSNWVIAGWGDFNGDTHTDILWRDSNTGTVAIWFLAGALFDSSAVLGVVPGDWSLVQTGDFNGDGLSDILWRHSSGTVAIWFMNSGQIASTAVLGNVGAGWVVQSANAE